MITKDPRFWWEKSGHLSNFFMPLSAIYSWCAVRNFKKKPPAVNVPVLCIGNFTLGGTGKTPTVIALAKAAKEKSLTPGIVLRGYGAKLKKQHIVDKKNDLAKDVGDEALLLSQHAKVVIGPDRFSSAQYLQKIGCDFILMDDGFQSRRLLPDYSLLVVDGARGFGNGKIFPAGPLRAPLKNQMNYTNSIVIIGTGKEKDIELSFSKYATKPIEYASLQPFSNSTTIQGMSFFAFAGIGNPNKFYKSIKELGGIVTETHDFSDHYFFKSSDLKLIADRCLAGKITPATTAKDYVRIISQEQTEILKNLVVFDVNVVFSNNEFCSDIIENTIKNFETRKNI